MENITPYKESADDKKKQVADMFNNIAWRYDFLNHFFSLNIDKYWRRKAIANLRNQKKKSVLDIATGTGDLAIEVYKQISPDKIVGIDISDGMLAVGKEKLKKMNLDQYITLKTGDSENIQFPTASFDAVTVAFGVRNFAHLTVGLSEILRVLRPGGKLVILEFSKPSVFPVKQFYTLYSKYILPLIGKIVSKDKAAYTYLPESVKAFPDGSKLTDIMREVGFTDVSYNILTFGIVSVYIGSKK